MFYAELLALRLHSVPFTFMLLSQVIRTNLFFMIVSESFWSVYAAVIINYFNFISKWSKNSASVPDCFLAPEAY